MGRKTNIMHLYAWGAALLALWCVSSCNKTPFKPADPVYDMRFEVVCTPNTKSTEFPRDYGVWAYDSKSREAELEGVALIRQDALWAPEKEYKWEAAKSLDIYSAAPLSRAVFDEQSGVGFEHYSLSELQDLLYTEPLLNRRSVNSLGVVSLDFRSALSLVRFKAVSRCAATTQVTVKGLKINGTVQNGSFCSLPSPKWTLEGECTPLLSFEGSQIIPSDGCLLCEQRLIPQSAMMRLELSCDFVKDGIYVRDQVLSTTILLDLKPGKLYELNLGVYDNYDLKIEKI
ncbi:MAG: fimbrillin family protein [Bacteroidales bacterium]|nr:fimbrillin family protein [Bacteroidales bacterium]